MPITNHENPNVQKVLDVLRQAWLDCVKVCGRTDGPEGIAVIVDGSRLRNICRSRLEYAVRALEEKTGAQAVRDTMFDRDRFDTSYVLRVGGEVISLMLAK